MIEPLEVEQKSVIIEALKKWGFGLVSMLSALVDVRTLLLIGGTALIARWVMPETAIPLIKTTVQLTLAFVFAVGVAHLIRKILLAGKFDLAEYAENAKDDPMASAVVFVSVLWFLNSLITNIVTLILK